MNIVDRNRLQVTGEMIKVILCLLIIYYEKVVSTPVTILFNTVITINQSQCNCMLYIKQ